MFWREINMAVTVSIEFTDAQWELIKEHYPKKVGEATPGEEASVPRIATVEELIVIMKDEVQKIVLKNKAIADKLTAANAFDV